MFVLATSSLWGLFFFNVFQVHVLFCFLFLTVTVSISVTDCIKGLLSEMTYYVLSGDIRPY